MAVLGQFMIVVPPNIRLACGIALTGIAVHVEWDPESAQRIKTVELYPDRITLRAVVRGATGSSDPLRAVEVLLMRRFVNSNAQGDDADGSRRRI